VRQGNSTQLRVLHLVSSNGVTSSTQQTLFMPLLTKAPKQMVAAEVVCLAPHAVPAAVLRQNGIPVHLVSLCRQRFSLSAFPQLVAIAREFNPDVIHAWGYTAQIVAGWLRKRCSATRVLMSATGTTPAAHAGFFEQRKLRAAARAAAKADRLIFSSEAAAAAHRRIGFPEEGHLVIPLGVDQSRFKPDPAAHRRVREQLSVPPNTFVIGMMAPFQPESDHVTFLKGVGELVKSQPGVHLLLAGHGVQKGNAPLMALVGSGNLATRTQLLGEWSDLAGFFNACDVVVSSAVTDSARMNLVMAMLCGVPCVATGVGEQGEVIGQCSVAIEPGSPAAVVRGIARVIEMPAERRAFLAQSSRKHALKNFTLVRSLQQYLQLYCRLLLRTDDIEELLPAPVEVELPVLAAQPTAAAVARPAAVFEQPADRRSGAAAAKEVIEWQPDGPGTATAPFASNAAEDQPVSDGDVLEIFESGLVPQLDAVATAAEATRPRVEEAEDLLAPEMLAASAGEIFRPRQAAAANGVRTSSTPSAVRPASKDTAASISPLRKTAPDAVSRPVRPVVEAIDSPAAKATAAKPAAQPAAVSASDLDATFQLDVLMTGAFLAMQPPKD
jgi:glycosyltransferase involved in cell wall biosynthesis